MSATLESVDGLAILIQLTVVPCPAVHIWHWAWQFQVFLVERRLIFVNLTQMVPLRYCGLICKWRGSAFSNDNCFISNIITKHMLKLIRSMVQICHMEHMFLFFIKWSPCLSRNEYLSGQGAFVLKLVRLFGRCLHWTVVTSSSEKPRASRLRILILYSPALNTRTFLWRFFSFTCHSSRTTGGL